jgi:hypothetical protein
MASGHRRAKVISLMFLYGLLSVAMYWSYQEVRMDFLREPIGFPKHLKMGLLGPVLSLYTRLTVVGYAIASGLVLWPLLRAVSAPAKRALYVALAALMWVTTGFFFATGI